MVKSWICCIVLPLAYINLAPMEKRFVDLTYVFDNDTIHSPSDKRFELNVTTNGTMNNTYWFQKEEYSSGVHVGTHLDAPCHFSKGRWSVDEIPLERLLAPAAVVDVQENATANPDYLVTIEDLELWEEETNQTLNDSILIIHSGWGMKWDDKQNYLGTSDNESTKFHFPGMASETAQWLVDERSVIGVGIDTLSLDNGIASEFRTHRILLEANIFVLENLANTDMLPIYGAMLYVMPMKIGNGCGAPARILATFPNVIYKSARKPEVLREIIVFSSS